MALSPGSTISCPVFPSHEHGLKWQLQPEAREPSGGERVTQWWFYCRKTKTEPNNSEIRRKDECRLSPVC